MEDPSRLSLARAFSRRARSLYGEMIEAVILYGSVSRGEDTTYSDIDLLVVVNDGSHDLQRDLSFLSFDMGLEEGEMISVQTISSSHMNERREFSFFQNISREGISLG